jgi:SAM-dependent methyltransferase
MSATSDRNPVRPDEWVLIAPHLENVRTMLELGNKFNEQVGRSYKAWFTETYGIEHVSVDVNGLDGALALDLRQPLTLINGRAFDMVTNIGTSEHVESDQHYVWKNMWDHLAVGGYLVSVTPLPGDWHWHGMWYPTEEFYDALAYRNDMALIELGEYGAPPRRCQFLVARKLQASAFVYPGDGLLYRNVVRQQA